MSNFDLADIYSDNVKLQKKLADLIGWLEDNNHITGTGSTALRKFNFDWGCALRPIKGSVVERYQSQVDIEDWLRGSQPMPALDAEIDWDDMSVRVKNMLQLAGLKTYRDVCQKTHGEMLREPNFGVFSLKELERHLARRGLHLMEAHWKAQRGG